VKETSIHTPSQDLLKTRGSRPIHDRRAELSEKSSVDPASRPDRRSNARDMKAQNNAYRPKASGVEIATTFLQNGNCIAARH